MNRTILLSLFTLLTSLLLSCGGSGLPRGEHLIPLSTRNEWTYYPSLDPDEIFSSSEVSAVDAPFPARFVPDRIDDEETLPCSPAPRYRGPGASVASWFIPDKSQRDEGDRYYFSPADKGVIVGLANRAGDSVTMIDFIPDKPRIGDSTLGGKWVQEDTVIVAAGMYHYYMLEIVRDSQRMYLYFSAGRGVVRAIFGNESYDLSELQLWD